MEHAWVHLAIPPQATRGAVILPFRPPRRSDTSGASRVTRPTEETTWARDIQRLGALARSPAARRARAAVSPRTRADRATDAVAAYCTQLLAASRDVTHLELLEIAYWIDRLTIALVRARRFDVASHWLERLARLPTRYTCEVSATARQRLARRHERCRRMATTSPQPAQLGGPHGRPRGSRVNGWNNSASDTRKAHAKRAMLIRPGLRSPRSTIPT